MGAGPAEGLELHVLAGDGLDDVRARDEHERRLVDHDREVGQRGGVHRAAGRGAHDQRDLRDDAGGVRVPPEDLAVEAERDDTLLDARAAAVVDADHRAADLHGHVHDLDDLLAVDLAERAAEHRRVLGEHADRAAVDGALAGDDAVAVGPVRLQPEVRGAVARHGVELEEAALVEEQVDALAGGLAAAGVLALDGALGAGVDDVFLPAVPVGQLPGRGVDVGFVRGLSRPRRARAAASSRRS